MRQTLLSSARTLRIARAMLFIAAPSIVAGSTAADARIKAASPRVAVERASTDTDSSRSNGGG